MAEYIHVITSTFQPIPRGSQPFAYENIPEEAAANYNATNGAAENRMFLPVERLDDPVRSDLVLERLVQPKTSGYATFGDDTTQPPNRDYDGQPSAPAPGPATWVIQKEIRPQTLAGAKREAQFIRAVKYADATAIGWNYELPNGSSRRIPFTEEFVNSLHQSCQRVLFAESRGIPTANRIPIRTDELNFDRPKGEVFDRVARFILDFGTFELLDINLQQAIRRAETPEQCRAELDAVVYPVL